jgi:hypothetical protein
VVVESSFDESCRVGQVLRHRAVETLATDEFRTPIEYAVLQGLGGPIDFVHFFVVPFVIRSDATRMPMSIFVTTATSDER